MTTESPAAVPTPSSRLAAASIVRLVATELRLVAREPVVLTFVFAFPVLTVLVLGNVFDSGDTAFEGIDPAQWYIAAYVGVVLAAIGLIMMPVHLAGYRHQGVVRRFRVSLFPRWALPFAQMIVGLAMAAVGIVALLIVSGLAYGVHAVENVPATVGALLFATITFVSMGVALGSVLPNARSAQGMGMLLFFPSFLLGGAGPPPDVMGDGMQQVSNLLPLTHAIRAIQEPWLDIGSPGDHFVVLAGWLAVSTAVWVWRALAAER